ncbi:bis(5'nucleosyl)-tetraphosphatase ApaH [Sinobacterium caligoides]|uniref:bis(5'-nucleosyl)-tetraphosphatase (symmetrical) n=1 Tax=Sinobacterium caligoides TaxID=933926 RepID=A0A3N2DP36_9GAMM|nr:symmetrical bis(5'-nucleosyl)-tetraphosphatase [Sinobacterium caligoides]ROS01550.1 bis(5'nucleosyl)-tetraphosphatase ApaH [Sinobacterium caligoides]
MSHYAVGDIQGCFSALQRLLDKVGFSASRDTLWVAGDLVNRGPESLETLRFIHSLGSSSRCVLGNHDLHLLAIAHSDRLPSEYDTLDDVLNARDWPTLERWLRQQPLMQHHSEYNIVMVHAGIAPQWHTQQALQLADEVHTTLSKGDYRSYFAAMYGNQPACWDDALCGQDRLRTITNYFTRMRFCNNNGKLDLEDKGHKTSQRPGYQPWFEFHQQMQPNSPEIVFGHWAALEGESNNSHYHALDTGYVWGGRLTLMELETKKRVSISNT